MEKVSYGRIEKKLYVYYENLQEIDALEKEIEVLKSQDKRIEEILKTNQYPSLSTDLKAIGNDERVQTSPNGSSQAESQMIAMAGLFLKEQKSIRHKMTKKEMKLMKLRRSTISISTKLERLNELEFKFVKYKYGSNLQLKDMLAKLHITKNPYYNLKNSIIEKLGKWMEEDIYEREV
ncbi:hypothetical protein [Clostridium sp. HBUAS56017]|uniref:hypothetical protein n=1 Tax=Clostridium sp. HBUAS56017 TaxID=2571128 RepID=UPI00117782D0|nr:hypothetical protein [Clostridium sp. HBUAS56017]